MLDTPGVYVREIPSGSRPIAGVSTSNTAFVGCFERGPVDRATRVTSYGEFERLFGGVAAGCPASYAVRSYFLNGGSVAFIVRGFNGDAEDDAASGSIAQETDGSAEALAVSAASPGAWGAAVHVAIAHGGSGTSFDLIVREYAGGEAAREETYIGLSTDAASPRYAETVVNRDSGLIRLSQTADALPARTEVDAGPPQVFAEDLDGLLGLDAARMTQLTGGDDGTTPQDAAGWPGAAQGTLMGDGATTGMYALDAIVPDVFNLMCLPDAVQMDATDATQRGAMAAIQQEAYAYCRTNFAFLLIDTPPNLTRTNLQANWSGQLGAAAGPNSALYFPRMRGADPLNPAAQIDMPASGAVAGIYARTDGRRGVWKAPAGTEARLFGGGPAEAMTDRQQGPLNAQQAVNCLRTFPVYGSVVWGARTLDGADARASEWKYVPVRRLTLHIESSLRRGLQWVVFEPNDESLWANIRLNVGSFMARLHRQGAFQGASARDAFLVKCDSETTTQADINLGVVNILVGFAPVRPAEFVVLRIQQRAQAS
ncbi:MAG: phage tail sheath family protein [Pseudomonadota bacterium]